MSVFLSEIEEYLLFSEKQQGNVNISGLIFDEYLYEAFDLEQTVYRVSTELLSEEISFLEGFSPDHICVLTDTFNFEEIKLGIPTFVNAVSLEVLHSAPVSPVDICFMQVDILHGPDTF